MRTDRDRADEIIKDLDGRKGVEDVFYKTKDEAMDEFRQRWGENAYLLDSLEENPLPNSIVIMISDLETADQVAQQAETYDGIEDVKFYKDTVDKLLKATKYIQIAAVVVMVFLIIVSIVVVSKHHKADGVQAGAGEISIMKYVGSYKLVHTGDRSWLRA